MQHGVVPCKIRGVLVVVFLFISRFLTTHFVAKLAEQLAGCLGFNILPDILTLIQTDEQRSFNFKEKIVSPPGWFLIFFN